MIEIIDMSKYLDRNEGNNCQCTPSGGHKFIGHDFEV